MINVSVLALGVQQTRAIMTKWQLHHQGGKLKKQSIMAERVKQMNKLGNFHLLLQGQHV